MSKGHKTHAHFDNMTVNDNRRTTINVVPRYPIGGSICIVGPKGFIRETLTFRNKKDIGRFIKLLRVFQQDIKEVVREEPQYNKEYRKHRRQALKALHEGEPEDD